MTGDAGARDSGGADADDGPTVLVVDDEESVAEAYRLWLAEEYDVEVATDGFDAIEAVDESIDVVLLDRRMPGISGDEVLEAIHDRGYDPWVAMVTAVDPDFDIVDMEFDAYLTKPVTREDLYDTVDRLAAMADYDRKVREYLSLARKRAALEDRRTNDELADSEEFAELTEKLERVNEDIRETMREVDAETAEALFRSLDDDSPGDFRRF